MFRRRFYLDATNTHTHNKFLPLSTQGAEAEGEGRAEAAAVDQLLAKCHKHSQNNRVKG